MKKTILTVAMAATLLWGGTAQGMDLTGTWEPKNGEVKCKGLSQGGDKSTGVDSNFSGLQITQSATVIRLRIKAGSGTFDNTFEGKAYTNSSDSSKGTAYGTACYRGTKVYQGAIYLPKVKVTATEGAFSFAYSGSHPSEIVSCKGKFTRTNATNPNVPVCP